MKAPPIDHLPGQGAISHASNSASTSAGQGYPPFVGGIQGRCLIFSPISPHLPSHSPNSPHGPHSKFVVSGPEVIMNVTK